MPTAKELEKRLESLENHLREENPLLLDAVQSFRKLDAVARGVGLLAPDASYATRISWWPLIAVLGTYSAGKSTFINHYLRYRLQATGNQAVDDRFSVICFSREEIPRVLPGIALDADARFPFYKMSRAIDEISAGEGSRIDAYLQLKTCPSDVIRGKILIDSPGFDADAQRTATLRITDRIVELADLVLVFFDARHPEPGTMQDTLEHLVAQTIHRTDSSKFLYILNQLDHTAKEDNPEDVVGSWQRALAQKGLTAGRFYCIYSPDAAIPIEDDGLRQRFESKRDADLAEIHGRMRQVEVDRAYRVMGLLEHSARDIEERLVPRIREMMAEWRSRVLRLDAVVFGGVAVALLAWTLWSGQWEGLSFRHPFWSSLVREPVWGYSALALVLLAGVYVHWLLREFAAGRVIARLRRQWHDMRDVEMVEQVVGGFRKNTKPWRSVFARRPAGWSHRKRRRLTEVIGEVNRYIQSLNDKFANPDGHDFERGKNSSAAAAKLSA